MAAYYNEFDPFAAQWLRNLIAAGHIAPGDVDDRSIKDVKADDLKRYGQCHFFAGIGVWSHALRLAGVSDDEPVWTGSCPCQPFSAAGKRGGTSDDRHLWPTWFSLIRQCKPPTIFGEQVSSKDGLGWFDLVHTDLESSGYAVGAADLCAAGTGAPHIRQRLWFVAYDKRSGLERPFRPKLQGRRDGLAGDGVDDGVGYAEGERRERGPDDGDGGGRQQSPGYSGSSSLADTVQSGRAEGRPISGDGQASGGFWSRAEWLHCTDGKARLAEPGIFPLAHGATQRMGRLRAYGNAICPQVAKAFIEVAMGYAP